MHAGALLGCDVDRDVRAPAGRRTLACCHRIAVISTFFSRAIPVAAIGFPALACGRAIAIDVAAISALLGRPILVAPLVLRSLAGGLAAATILLDAPRSTYPS
jgi:hypothetical protein